MMFYYKPFKRIRFILIYICITTPACVIAKNCATDHTLLKHTLQNEGTTITNIPTNQQIPNRQPIKPIVALPFDLKQFHTHP